MVYSKPGAKKLAARTNGRPEAIGREAPLRDQFRYSVRPKIRWPPGAKSNILTPQLGRQSRAPIFIIPLWEDALSQPPSGRVLAASKAGFANLNRPLHLRRRGERGAVSTKQTVNAAVRPIPAVEGQRNQVGKGNATFIVRCGRK